MGAICSQVQKVLKLLPQYELQKSPEINCLVAPIRDRAWRLLKNKSKSSQRNEATSSQLRFPVRDGSCLTGDAFIARAERAADVCSARARTRTSSARKSSLPMKVASG